MTFNQVLKIGNKVFLGTLLFLIVILNLRLYYSPDFAPEGAQRYNADVYQQLQFLKSELHAGAATEMQDIFPEGYLFLNALYALTWADFAVVPHDYKPSNNSDIVAEAIEEIDWSLSQIDAHEGTRIFDESLVPKYGIFYRGWRNYALARRVEVEPNKEKTDSLISAFRNDCDAIAQAYLDTEGPWLETFQNSAWPADNVLAIASLAEYDRLFTTNRYREIIRDWVEMVKLKLDPATGLIPHSIVFATGQISEGARGSSQSLMHCLLPAIDPVFAKKQYTLYQKHFVTSRIGLPGIREYPYSIQGSGDIDSGPVIWGVGGAASVVGQRAAALNGDGDLYVGLRNAIEIFGVPITWRKRKRYLLGYLPIADAFIAWSNSVERRSGQFTSTGYWRIPLQLIFLFLYALFLRRWRKL